MKLKIINRIFAIGFIFGLFSSCNYLDVSDELAGGITDISQVFNNVDRTKKWYGQVFEDVPDYSRMWNTHGMGNIWAFYADELYSRIANNSGKYTEWNSSNTNSNRWYPLYERIRQANIFLERAKPVTEEGGPAAARLTEPEVERYKANVRFMRAAYYFYLMELYGPVPIVTQSLSLEDELDVPRNSLDEVINFIDTELIEAMVGMEQEPYHSNESYRAVPTKGTALALRAKLWAYAASKLFNGGFAEGLLLKNKDGKRLFPDYDAGKLQKAVQANKEFIEYAEQGGRYELYKNLGTFSPAQSVYELFQEYNREIIWATSKSNWGGMDNTENFDHMATPRSEGGTAGIHVLQELVDEFYMADGLPIKATSFLSKSPDYDASESTFGTLDGFEVSNMYIGREPRFYNTVTFSGKKWQLSNKEVQFYYGGNADKTVPDGAPLTGYVLFKRYNRTLHKTLNTGVKSKYRPSIIFRLADFYLLYAEVLNEVEPANTDVLKYVNLVRERAGLPNLETLNPAIAGNKELQREAIRRERRIELATEGQRYFDVRRWMIAENEPGEGGQGGDFTGMNPDGGKTTGFHVRKKFHTRTFKRKNYFFPISLEDMQRSNVLVQNPGGW
ncbi:MAG: RagB/SusD family nutrient uptake outer membrane protein [Candidatus Symbiothrix sp.]|jgi:hypothetical protein|nr:RagB/SusD family nutrient uptake outer membrane protein [Candidatus Symbiothrix sp.]